MGRLKRGLVSILLVLLFSFVLVNAEIIVNGPDQSKVNIGGPDGPIESGPKRSLKQEFPPVHS
ncbi:hypothetical protein HOB91_03275 [Candidatus Woesearchaeota archaeon]|jgi:hypothetical protein|nr:hypothetical protein [Candidatus Woesearchaeota archaeon]